MKKVGYVLTLCMVVLSIAVCIFGVYAAQTVSYNITGKITYTVENYITPKTNITSLSATRVCSHKNATGNVSTSTGVDIGDYFTVILNGETLTNSEIVTNITNNILTVSPQTGLTYSSGKIYMTPSQIITTNGKTVQNSYTLTLALKSDSTTKSQISISTTTTVGSWSSNLSTYSYDNYSATCETAGWKGVERCSVCDAITDSGSLITALGHNYNSGVVTTAATCTTKGVRTYTCQRTGCGKTKTEEIAIDSTNHDWKETTAKVSAQNHVDGTGAIYTCSRCSATKGGETLTRLHASYEVVDSTGYSATCTATGKGSGTYCTQCSYDTRSTIDKLGHSWNSGEVTTAATCTTKGVKTYTCQRTGCGETYTEDIPALGHDYEYAYSYTQSDTNYYKSKDSDDHGYHIKTTTTTCSRCSYKTTSSENEYCDLTQYVDSTWSTNSEAHWKHYYSVCSLCNGRDSSSNSDSDSNRYAEYSTHNGVAISSNYIAPTCTTEGVQYYKCSTCSTEYRGSISALGHDYKYSVKYTINDTRYYDTDADDHGYHNKITTTTCSRCDYSSTKTEIEDCSTTETVQSTYYSLGDVSHYRHRVTSCSLCGGLAYGEDVLDYHAWNSGVTTRSATCTGTGTIVYTCTACSYQKTDTIAALGHNWGSWSSYTYTPEDCDWQEGDMTHKYSRTRTCSRCSTKDTDSGSEGCDLTESIYEEYNTSMHWTVHKATCSKCKQSDSYTTDSYSHSYTSSVLISATCTSTGTMKYSCKNCDYYYTGNISKTSHNYSVLQSSAVAATCTTAGSTAVYKCKTCSATSGGLTISALGHSYSKSSSTVVSNGNSGHYTRTTYTCSRCRDSYSSNGSPTSHSLSETTTKSATCTSAGSTYTSCSSCSYSTTGTIAALGHNYSSSSTSYVSAGAAGHYSVTTKTCSRCSNQSTTTGSTTSHSCTGTVTTAATCASTGTMTYSCKSCSYSYTQAIPKTSTHSYSLSSSKLVNAGTSGHYTQYTYKCGVCSTTKTETSSNASHSLSYNKWTGKYSCSCGYSSSSSIIVSSTGGGYLEDDLINIASVVEVNNELMCADLTCSCVEYTDTTSDSSLAVVDATACVETGLGKKICVSEDE